MWDSCRPLSCEASGLSRRKRIGLRLCEPGERYPRATFLPVPRAEIWFRPRSARPAARGEIRRPYRGREAGRSRADTRQRRAARPEAGRHGRSQAGSSEARAEGGREAAGADIRTERPPVRATAPLRFRPVAYSANRFLNASMLLPAPCDLPGTGATSFTVDASNANVITAAATASALTSRACRLTLPTRS